MSGRGLVLMTLVGLTMGPSARAAEAPLTLELAIARATELSVSVQLQELSSEAAEARWLADPRVGAPSIRIGLRDLEVPVSPLIAADPPEVTARVRFPFPRPWELASAARQGVATVEREDAELEAIRDRVRLAVTTHFHSVPLLREAVATSDRLMELRGAHLAMVDQRRREGFATALDWLDSEEERRDVDDRRSGIASKLESEEAELRLMLQWPADEPLEILADKLSDGAEVPPLVSLMEGVRERNPAVREARAEIDRSKARLHRLQLGALPWLDWAQAGAVFKTDTTTSFEVGFAVDVPIYMWSPARTRAAAQELAGAKLQLREVEHSGEQRLARRARSASAARDRWLVETAHHAAISEHAEPLLELADPLVRIELEARMVRAELRVLAAYVDLVEELDRLAEEAHR